MSALPSPRPPLGRPKDPAKRAAILQKVEAMLIDDAAYVPLHWEDLAYGAKKNVDIKPVVNVMNFPYLGDLVVNK